MPSAVVIGRGVIGAAIALELARRGWDVTGIDRHAAAGHGSTSASSGVVRTYYSTRDGTALAWEGFHAWRAFAAELEVPAGAPAATMREVGCLVLDGGGGGDGSGAGLLRTHRAIADALGIPWAWWDADEIARRVPGIDLSRYAPVKRPDDPGFAMPGGAPLAGGVWWPCSGYVADPMLAAQNLWDAAARAGARALRGTVVGFDAAPGPGGRVRAVRLDGGDAVAADVIVNAAGPASGRINALAGAAADMGVRPRPKRQEVVHLPPAPGSDIAPQTIMIADADAGVYSRPERNGVLVGSLEPPCDPPVHPEDADAVASEFTDQWDAQAMRYAQRMPAQGLPRRRAGVVACYDVTEDWLPIYDRSARPGFYMACGTSGNQFKVAPVAGHLMAELIGYVEGGGDQDGAPLEVALPRTGLRIGTGTFSRLRRPNAQSSGTVLG